MYELIILTQLMRGPRHGYVIAKVINDIIGPYAKISNGRLYPLLAKLEETNLIVASDEGEPGERSVRTYKITASGIERFKAMMMDTQSNPGEYQKIFTLKVSAFSFISASERIYLIEHFLNYCQSHVLHLRAELNDLIQNKRLDDGNLERIQELMSHRIKHWQLDFDFGNYLYQKEKDATS
jgi:DNA-binding PadR family transcriptional regulator